MKRKQLTYFISSVLIASFALSACEPTETPDPVPEHPLTTLTDAEAAQGWRLLFDGQSHDQWRGFQREDVPSGWVVENGALHFTGSNGGDIITREQFEDFELELEWMISEGGNSGIFFHVVENDRDVVWHSGPEYQLLDDQAHPDLRPEQFTASDYDLYAPENARVRPAGEWNESRIVVNEGRVEYFLNGQKTVEYQLGSEEWRERVQASKFNEHDNWGLAGRGHIALQDHGDPVWFRNIRIREIGDDPS